LSFDSGQSEAYHSEPEPMTIDEEESPRVVGATQYSNYFTQSQSSQATQSASDFAASQLEKAFGQDAQFKNFQQEVIDALVEHSKRILLVQPAGWGKTFVYMTAAKALRERTGKVTLIVCPLLALIRNQIAAAEQYGVSVNHICASLKSDEVAKRKALWRIYHSQVDAVIATPELLSDRIFDQIFKNIGMVVVDEAHCVCQWGYNFRLAYGQLELLMDRLKQYETDSDVARPVLVLSSTITNQQERHLRRLFNIQEPAVRGLLPLGNIHLEIVRVKDHENALIFLADIIPKLSGIGIVYCFSVDKAESLAFWLRSKGITARAYHSNVMPDALDLEDNEKATFRDDSERYRTNLEHKFLNCAIDVLVSTSALSMGVDIPNIRYVIILEPPASLQVMYQQFGRAGRGTAEKALGVVVDIGGQLPSSPGDVFFTKKDVTELCTAIQKSSSSMTASQLETECNLPVKTVENILTYFSTMKRPIVAYDTDEKVWKKADGMNERHIARVCGDMEETRNALIQENEIGICRVQEFLENNDKCMMKLLCMDLGGKEIPEDYCCNSCTVCTNDIKVNAPERSADDLDMVRLRLSGVRPLMIQKSSVTRNAFRKYQFRPAFLGNPRTDVCGISVSSYYGGALAEELKELLNKSRYRPMQQLVSDQLIHAIVKIFHWPKVSSLIPATESVVWVTYIPSTDVSDYIMESFAQRFASKLRCQFRKAVELMQPEVMKNKWSQKNAYFRCRNLDGAYDIQKQEILPGPVILIDYLVRSGWTMVVVSELLQRAGSGPVFPLALLKMAKHFKYE